MSSSIQVEKELVKVAVVVLGRSLTAVYRVVKEPNQQIFVGLAPIR